MSPDFSQVALEHRMESKTRWCPIKDTGVRGSFDRSIERELEALEAKWKAF